MSRRMLISLISIIFFMGILLLLLPDIQEVPEERMASAAMAMCVVNIKKDISSDIKKGNKIKTDFKIKCPKLISKLNVSSNGDINMFNSTYGIQLLFKPNLKNGVVSWSCLGTPAGYVPKACQVKDVRNQGSGVSGQ